MADYYVADLLARRASRVPSLRVPDDVRRDVHRAGRAGLHSVPWVATAILVLVVGWMLFWTLYVGRPAFVMRPGAIPTAVPTPTARTIVDPWAGHQWLSQEEARALRSRPNVVNLAMLGNNGASYSATYSVNYAGQSGWKQSRPSGVTLTVNGTRVQFTHAGATYHLNMFQPFVLKESPTTVYVVNSERVLMEADLSVVQIVPLSEVSLPQTIDPNPDLSFTLGR
jgi:hypothetical protein